MELKHKPRLHASWIAPEAISIIEILQRKGFTCYLVGGCVRDLLVGIIPKDFDIATNALPQEVKKSIWGSYIIGKRFRLVLVRRHDLQFEVATFRRAVRPEDLVDTETAPPTGDNFFGSPEEDAIRRDFTINALFYDPIKQDLIDYAEGIKDIEDQTVRMIGDPVTRIREDAIRSLRAIRLAHKLGFKLEPSLRQGIQSEAAEVVKSVLPRRREEYIKILKLDDPGRALLEMLDLGLIDHLLPSLLPILNESERAAIFFHYLTNIEDFTEHSTDTVDLYMPLILAFHRAGSDLPNFIELRDRFIKDELGMFKTESFEVLGALELIDRLQAVESFKKRGYRRQQSFIRQSTFPRALKVAQLDHLLKPSDQVFWLSRLSQAPEA